jgi:hypothetical protein
MIFTVLILLQRIDSAGQVDQEFPKPVKPRTDKFDDLSTRMAARNGLHSFYFFTTLLDMLNIGMGLYDQNSRLACVTFVGAEVLFSVLLRQD